MLDELKKAKKLVGLKQSLRAIEKHEAICAYVASDCMPEILDKVIDCCNKNQVPVINVDTMAELGSACGIDVGAAVVAILN